MDNQQNLRIGFAGTPVFAATILEGLLAAGFPVALVLTQPDRAAGRGRRTRPSPVKQLAHTRGIEVRDPPTLRRATLDADHLDLLVVAAYGLILPPHILEAPRLGCVNVHASLLPRWRGAAPVERAIMAGDTETGVCLMQMDAGLDTGPIFCCERVAIGESETGGHLEGRLAEVGAHLLVTCLPRIETLTATPQPTEGASYAHKLTPMDSRLDWSESPEFAARKICALADRQPVTVLGPAPHDDRAATERPPPETRIRLLGARALSSTVGGDALPGTILAVSSEGVEVACGGGRLLLTRVQLNRGKGTPMTATSAANGFPELFSTTRVLRSLTAPEGITSLETEGSSGDE